MFLPITVVGRNVEVYKKEYLIFIKERNVLNKITIIKDKNKLGNKKKNFILNKLLSFINNTDNGLTPDMIKLLEECKC